MRHVFYFLLLGTLLFWGKRTLVHATLSIPTITVQVGSDASQADVDAAIDDAVLLERALVSRTALLDPIVREQLLRAMRRDSKASRNDVSLISEAVRLGLHRVEPLARQRLIFQAKQMLRADTVRKPLSESELRHYLSDHRERYEIPERRSFQQVFVSRTRHRARLEQVARSVELRLARASDGSAAASLSDPSLLPYQLVAASAERVRSQFGDEFAQAVFETNQIAFVGPLRSSYGLHFVRVTERQPARTPTLDEVRGRVEFDCRHDRSEREFQSKVHDLRRQYRIRVRRSAS